MTFLKFGLHADLLHGVKELGFTRPTPIQQDAIPPAMAGDDLLACAMTGSGKTAAFMLPILHHLIGKKRGVTRALVLTPTRELAAQIAEHTSELAVHTPISAAAVYGGVGMGPQEHAFRSGVDVIVATPGRLLDHFRHPYARLSGLEVLVLDEADRMLDMGFLPDIRRVVSRLPARRQTLFFSATMPAPIGKLAREMLRDPVQINLERKSAPATGIRQAVYPVPQAAKSELLVRLLQQEGLESVLVFTRTKHRANRLAALLEKRGVQCGIIHGNRSQSQRTKALSLFKNGRMRVLVATDIAARGIDVEELSHVINFDVPNKPEDYIHRVGRTARADATGDAFTFVAPDEEESLRDIEKAVGKRLPRVTLPDFDMNAVKAEPRERGGRSQGGGRRAPAARRPHGAQSAGRRGHAAHSADRRPHAAAPAADRRPHAAPAADSRPFGHGVRSHAERAKPVGHSGTGSFARGRSQRSGRNRAPGH